MRERLAGCLTAGQSQSTTCTLLDEILLYMLELTGCKTHQNIDKDFNPAFLVSQVLEVNRDLQRGTLICFLKNKLLDLHL